MRAEHREAGFTLVELLVALTLFALLAALLFGGLRFAGRAVAAGDTRLERSAELSLATGFLRRALTGAEPLPRAGSDGQTSVAFEGERDALAFASLPPAYLAPPGYYWLRLGVESGDRLVLRWEAIGKDQVTASPAPTLLLERVHGIELAYFGALDPYARPQWHERWERAPLLPLLVRLRLTFSDGSRAPDILVAPRLSRGTGPGR
ncbi:MAG TPA: prepilin-type N-terminal cleavage/methylation domain-containing protein [Stellaceae bacterium]|nr:prepilin-type N-terminal cleavage/methylation domain-containing protein [Stellaceae bacterium]